MVCTSISHANINFVEVAAIVKTIILARNLQNVLLSGTKRHILYYFLDRFILCFPCTIEFPSLM